MYCAYHTISIIERLDGLGAAQMLGGAGPGVLLTTLLTIASNMNFQLIRMMYHIHEMTSARKDTRRRAQYYLLVAEENKKPLSFPIINAVLREDHRMIHELALKGYRLGTPSGQSDATGEASSDQS